MKKEDAQVPAADGAPVERGVGRLEPERAGFLAQIEACRREVAQWPEWMRATTSAPKWMEGWDD
jgi:hypothetical protein